MAIGDLDGDGRNDVALLTSSYFDPANDYMVHVFLQAADGTLQPRVKYPVGRRSSSIDIGDVNGDGRADVVVGLATALAERIGVLLQNASGTLDPLVSYPTVNSYPGEGRRLQRRRSDGRRRDQLGSSATVSTCSCRRRPARLAPPVTYHAPHGGLDELDAGDIDGDGRTDLVVMSGQVDAVPNLNVLLQTPDGTLGAPTSYSLGGNLNTNGVAVGDTNGDGRTDIVVSYGGNKPDLVHRAVSAERAGRRWIPRCRIASYDIPPRSSWPTWTATAARTCSSTHGGWNRLGVYRQYPSGDFVNEELLPDSRAQRHYQPQGLAVGDISGDGRPDAVIADYQQRAGRAPARQRRFAGAGGHRAGRRTLYDVGAAAHRSLGGGRRRPARGLRCLRVVRQRSSYAPIAGCTGLPAHRPRMPLDADAASSGHPHPRHRPGQRRPDRVRGDDLQCAPAVDHVVRARPSTQYVGTATTIVLVPQPARSGGTVRIELSRDGGATVRDAGGRGPQHTAAFTWTVTGPTTSQRARARDVQRFSARQCQQGITISIRCRRVTVSVPAAGGDVYTPSLFVAGCHDVGGASTPFASSLSRDGGATFQTIAASAPNGEGVFSGSRPGARTRATRVFASRPTAR